MMQTAQQHEADSSPVHVGKDGWLFLVKGSNSVLNMYQDPSSFTPELADAWVKLLQSRSRNLQARDIQYFHLPAPEKLTVLHRFYDGEIANIQGSPIRNLVNHHHAKIPCLVNLVPAFEQQQENRPIYWKTDTHWSFWGCFSAYQKLCSRMGVPSRPELMRYPFNEGDVLFDLGAKLPEPLREKGRFYNLNQTATRTYANPMVRFKEENQLVNEPSLHVGSHIVYKNDAEHAIDKRVILFGDSFSEYRPHLLTGMMAETFRELHFIWNSRLDYEYIDLIQPDIVVSELAERFMVDVPVDDLCIQTFSNDRIEKYKRQRLDQEMISASTPIRLNTTPLLDEEQYPLKAPITLAEQIDISKGDEFINTEPSTLTQVDAARLYFDGARCIVKTADGHIVTEYGNDRAGRLDPWLPCKPLKGTTLLLGDSLGAHCYYHWMLDILPKFGLLEKAGINLHDIDHILVREMNNSFHKETLENLGVDLTKVIETEKDSLYQCEHLLTIALDNGINMKMNRFIPSWLNSKFITNTESDERIKLYISRPKGVRRGVANEEDLIPILKENGFTIQAMEGMSVAEQAQLLRRVDVLISPHGGALTNMVFAKSGIKVIELFGRHVYPYYYGLASVCGHDYSALLENPSEDYARLVHHEAAAAVGSAEHQQQTRALGFDVDVDAFRRLVTDPRNSL